MTNSPSSETRGPEAGNALLDYVRRPDDAFCWRVRETHRLPDGVVYDLHLVSQVWQGIRWQHRILVHCPSELGASSSVLLRISGGHGDNADLAEGLDLARQLGAPFALLCDIPNQPLLGGRVEDDLVAETFLLFLDTGDNTWPLLLPMTKSVVCAMDALQAFGAEVRGAAINEFVLTGASKRGWTTWLTSAADARVKALIPQVFDNLKFLEQMPHQLETWGEYSEQIHDYTERGLQERMWTPDGRRLVQAVDPHCHRERILQPKLIINGTNDRYWTLDALNFYWDDLQGESHVLYVPNSGHGLEDRRRVTDSMVAFFRHVVANRPMPQLDWRYQAKGRDLHLTVQAQPEPVEVRLWTARSRTLDFRCATWTDALMTRAGNGHVGEVSESPEAHTAAFGEAVFEDGGRTFTLSTQVCIDEAS